MTNMENNIINSHVTDYTFLDTVDINKAYFHRRGIKLSDKSIILLQLVGWPSTQTLKEVIEKIKSETTQSQ